MKLPGFRAWAYRCRRFSVLLCCLYIAGCSIVGIRSTEEASFTLLEKNGDIEIRQYAPVMAVQTRVQASDFDEATNIAFRRLFNYITGENAPKQSIAMTAPVIATPHLETHSTVEGKNIEMTTPVRAIPDSSGQKSWVLQFVLPDSYNPSNSPDPIHPEVTLLELPEKTVATIQFSGSWSNERFEQHINTLEHWITHSGYTSRSSPVYAGYDPPWTLPFLRRNEVLIEVNPKP